MRHARPFFLKYGGQIEVNDGAFDPVSRLNPKQRPYAARCTPNLKLSLLESLLPTGGDEAVALIIYTKPGCPYCQQARDYYNSKGITFIDRDAQTNKEFRAQMFKYSGGDPTVPCIVKDGKYVQSGWGDPLRG
jgi:glutaredoxin